MNPSLAWSTFTNTLTGEVVGSEVWASALRQMTIRECVDGVVSFACPNNGVKTIAQNRQRDLLSLTTRALCIEVRGIIIDVVDEKIKTKTKTTIRKIKATIKTRIRKTAKTKKINKTKAMVKNHSRNQVEHPSSE